MKVGRLSIFCGGECVGFVTNISFEMLCVEGDWTGNEVSLSRDFEWVVKQLDDEAVIEGHTQGVVVRCRDDLGDAYMAVVTGLRDGVLG